MKNLLIVSLIGLSTALSASIGASGAHADERALIAYMEVESGSEQAFLNAAVAVIEESRREAGNLQYQLHQSVRNPQLFVFYELFKSDADLQYHRNSPHVKHFLAETKSITQKFTIEEYAPTGEQ